MLTGRAITFPIPSEIHHHHHQHHQPPRASLEHEARSEPRTSSSDEAQACFNLILILRNDTQHLIALRNDNIQSLEETAAARPLLTGINDAITAATRSIHELGPFLERHRWPPEPPAPPSSRTSMRLKVLARRRCRSLSVPSAGAKGGAAGGGGGGCTDSNLSPEELFSWTLALTAQHAAVLGALARLEEFLVHGTAALSDEDRRRHDATQSWWQQRRSEFENVGLIQSILQGPRRCTRRCTTTNGFAAAVQAAGSKPEAREIGFAVTPTSPATATGAKVLPSISEHEDGRLGTIMSYEQSVRSSPGEALRALTGRPRARTESLPLTHCRLPCEIPEVSFLGPGPRTHPQPSPAAVEIQTGPHTFKTPSTHSDSTPPHPPPRLPLSLYNSNAQRPRIATTPLPPLVGLQGLYRGNPPRATAQDPHPMVSPVSPCSPYSPVSPMLSPPGLSQNSSRVSLPSPLQVSPTAETPYTPLDQQVATMIAQKALPTKTIQPVIHELNSVLLSPVDSLSPVLELGASPVSSSHYSRGSLPPSLPPSQGRVQQGRGEIIVKDDDDVDDDDDRHWPYLAYMARKQAVATSRWSIRRSHSKREG